VLDTPALVARTGYTGEDGFELFLPNAAARAVWDALLAAGADGSLRPIGLGARDTLRLEAGMPLYGNELERDVRPAEAGLGRVVKLDKPGGFVGRDALAAAEGAGPRHQLVTLILREPGIARHGYPVLAADAPDDTPIGIVTSGTQSPTLGMAIAMARVPPALTAPGTMVRIGIRASTVLAEVVPSPFYRRPPAGATPSR
jgi:aminomethyltransferase